MEIDLSYLPDVTSEHFYPLYINQSKYLILYGGVGSGKSVFAIQKIVFRILTEQQTQRFLVVRKIGAKLRTSVFNEFIAVLKDWGLLEYAVVTSSPMLIKFPLFNDSEIQFTGIDDSEKIKSISRITSIFIEESTELEEKDLDDLIDRLRGNTAYYKQVVICFNPINQNHWLKKKFFDSEDLKSETTIHHSTYKHNRFIDPAYGTGLIKRYRNNENAYRVKVLGLWGNPSIGGEFYSSFNHSKNTSPVAYDAEYPVILSWDFNVLPFSACLVGQLVGKELRLVDEIALDHPNNRPLNVIKEFKRRYPNHLSGVFVTGDASGKNNSTRTEDGVNDYTGIFEELRRYSGVKDSVPSKNPNVFQRGEFINALFAGDIPETYLAINESCENLIEDLINLKRDEDGTKLKKRVKDKDTGQSMEQYGHMSDALDIMVCVFLKNDFKKFLRGGETVLHVGNSYISPNLF